MKKNIKWIIYALIAIIIVIAAIILFLFLRYKLNSLDDKNELYDNDDYTYKVTINLNGADKVDEEFVGCKNDQDGKCIVTLPKAYRANAEIIGYDVNSDSHEAKYKENEKLELESNLELYVISKKENILHIVNDNIDYLEKNDLSCTTYNYEYCNINVPGYNKKGYVNLGLATDKDATVGSYFPGNKIELHDSITLYPVFDDKQFEVINVGKSFQYGNTILEVEHLSPETNKRLQNILDAYKKAGVNINREYDEPDKEENMEIYTEILEKIKNKASFITNNYSKIFLLSWDSYFIRNHYVMDGSFNYLLHHIRSAGTYGPAWQNVEILCCRSEKVNDGFQPFTPYEIVIHELAHVWDNKSGISENEDIKAMYKKYKDDYYRRSITSSGANEKLFGRSNVYKDILEFFAYSYSWYYLKYIDPVDVYKDYDYPADLKNVMDKYTCLAKNSDDYKCLNGAFENN